MLRRFEFWWRMKLVCCRLPPSPHKPYEDHSVVAVCKLVFLPPYSPDYNPIEQAFSSIKAFLRRNWTDTSLSAMDRACQNITYDKAAGYFRASGYIV